MSAYMPSSSLLSWAKRLGLEFRPPNGYPAAFYNAGWEDRYFVYHSESALPFHVTQATRSSEENFLFDAYSADVVDSYFWMFFGSAIRLSLGLPRLRPLMQKSDVAAPYSISGPLDEKLTLIDGRGQAVMFTSDSMIDVGRLVKTSIALTSSIEEIEQSFLSDSGAPIFQPADMK
jgi:hypothetical protein